MSSLGNLILFHLKIDKLYHKLDVMLHKICIIKYGVGLLKVRTIGKVVAIISGSLEAYNGRKI